MDINGLHMFTSLHTERLGDLSCFLYESVRIVSGHCEFPKLKRTVGGLSQSNTIPRAPKDPICSNLVGGFNPFIKDISQIGSSPQVRVKIKNI